ncbi:MAG: hypothetical protein ACI38A_01895, partial [Candidatus Ornithomonoglobus sp.]
MTLMQLGHFTHEELSHFTHKELSLNIDDLLSAIRDENRIMPVQTYETLLSLVEKYHIPVPEHSNSEWNIDRRLKLLSIIVQIIMGIIGSGLNIESNTVQNNYYNINVRIQSSIGKSDNSDLEYIC